MPAAARCGTLEVFENRGARAGRRIPLRIVLLPARSSQPAPDPVFVLAGGPGDAATTWAAGMAEDLEEVLEERDVVLVDQRGTGGSNPLDCDLGAPGVDLFHVEAVRACREALARRADLSFYGTATAMADLDEVRQALGYERINLFGASYGTMAAQVYLRAYPERTRSAVLIAPGRIDPEPWSRVARDVQRALDLLAADCAADPACHAAIPDVKADLQAVVTRLEREPVRILIPDPAAPAGASGSKPPVEVVLTADLLRLILPTRLYSPEAAARVPASLHRAARGDFRELARAALVIARGQFQGGSLGMRLSIDCSESPPPDPSSQTAREAARGTFLGDFRLRWQAALCSAWPRFPLPPGFFEPVRSDAPVLLLSGDLDPILPAEHAEEVARHLRNARRVVVPSASHYPLNGCTRRLIRDFLRAGTGAGLDTSCVASTRRPAFVLPD